MESLAAKIKRLRTAKKLTQDELGAAVGVSRVAVTKWENGDTENLKLANLKRLCSVFGISVAELIDVKADYALANNEGKALGVAEGAAPAAPIYSLKPTPATDPDIDAVVALMQNTDKTGRSIVLVQVKLALSAYKPAESNHAS